MNRNINKFIHKYTFLSSFLLVFIICAVVLSGWKLIGSSNNNKKEPVRENVTQTTTQTQTQTQTENITETTPTESSAESLEADTEESTQESEPETTQEEEETTSVVEKHGDSAFSDALFIGDSRVEYLRLYAHELSDATFWSEVGLDITGVMSSHIAKVGGGTVSVEEGLKNTSFGKIYIQVGINEIGTGTDSWWVGEYSNLINTIQMYQPNAAIYIMAIQHVVSGTIADWDNPTIDVRNSMISQLADNQSIFYINTNWATDDDKGQLNPQYTKDGVHTTAKYVSLVQNYIIDNTK